MGVLTSRVSSGSPRRVVIAGDRTRVRGDEPGLTSQSEGLIDADDQGRIFGVQSSISDADGDGVGVSGGIGLGGDHTRDRVDRDRGCGAPSLG